MEETIWINNFNLEEKRRGKLKRKWKELKQLLNVDVKSGIKWVAMSPWIASINYINQSFNHVKCISSETVDKTIIDKQFNIIPCQLYDIFIFTLILFFFLLFFFFAEKKIKRQIIWAEREDKVEDGKDERIIMMRIS